MRSASVLLSKTTLCQEKLRLMEDFMASAADLIAAHNDQMTALLADDPDFSRFDVLIHLASERKRAAKYAYIAHLERHGC